MRDAVKAVLALGPMPDEDATEEAIDAWSDAIDLVETPIQDDEAAALAKCFPPDMGYGVGWTLLHTLETAPGWLTMASLITDPEWRARAERRIANAADEPPYG